MNAAHPMASVRSPDALARDPFELDRLAEELAARESSKRLNGTHSTNPDYDDDDDLPAEARTLPVYVPLSHADPHLSAPTFDVERFLLSRAYTSLPDLRTELRDYLAALKEELVRLINDDYEAFISLITDLRGEGARLEGMKRPLAELKGRVLVRRACFGVCCVRANEVTVFFGLLRGLVVLVVRVVGSEGDVAGHTGRDQGEAGPEGGHPGGKGVLAPAAEDLRVHNASGVSLAHLFPRG